MWGGHCSVGLVGPLMFAQYQLVQAIFGPYTIYTLKGSTTTKTINFASNHTFWVGVGYRSFGFFGGWSLYLIGICSFLFRSRPRWKTFSDSFLKIFSTYHQSLAKSHGFTHLIELNYFQIICSLLLITLDILWRKRSQTAADFWSVNQNGWLIHHWLIRVLSLRDFFS